MATNGEMIDKIQEWINTDGELLSDEQVLENIRELVNGGGLWTEIIGVWIAV